VFHSPSIGLADSDGDLDSYNDGLYPCGENWADSQDGRGDLRRNIYPDAREEEDKHVAGGVRRSEKVQNDGVEELH
jgi:hypothetical protein